jgi:hypothetical protein
MHQNRFPGRSVYGNYNIFFVSAAIAVAVLDADVPYPSSNVHFSI